MITSFCEDLLNLALEKEMTIADAFVTFGRSLIEDLDLTDDEMDNFLASVRTQELDALEEERKEQIYESRHKLESLGMRESDFM